MSDIKILHTADWHIGSFSGPEKNGENARYLDIVKCLDALVEGAKTNKPDIIIVAGDIFHQARVWSDRGLKENQTAIRIIRELEKVAPIVIMRGTPNHDSTEQFRSLESAFEGDDSVSIITDPCIQTYCSYSGKKVQIACIPGFDRGYYRAKHPGLSKEEENEVFTQAVADMIIGLKAQAESDIPTVLVSHFTITGCNMESGQTAFFSQFEPVVYPETLVAADYDLVCFGHIHRPQQVKNCKNTFYSGAVSALNFNDEGQQRGYYVHTLGKDARYSDFFDLPTREYMTIRLTDDDIREINTNGPEWLYNLPLLDDPEAVRDKIIRVLYDCTDEHNKAFNHAVLENWLYSTGKAFWIQEITPQKITITVDRKSMEADNTPEDNLREYLLDKDHTPEEVVEIINLARLIISEAMERASSERHTGTFVPVEIEVKNYRNYRDEKFSFDGVRFCTINGSNGVGKSSLFMDAMVDALFEETREGELTGWICNAPDARSGSIKFTFKLGEQLYRVTRTRQKSGKATLNIAELVDGEWCDRSKEKIRDTQAEIINIIGMDSLTLKACALIMQDQYGLFLQADKEARMNILGSILGLGIYGKMEQLAAEKATETNREIRLLTERADTITAGLPKKDDILIAVNAAEQRKATANGIVEAKTKEADELKVSLNIQYEAAARVMKLNDRITSLTAKKATKETQRTAQTAIIISSDNILSQEETIMRGVAEYAELLEQEKTMIERKAQYDSITDRHHRLVESITSLTATVGKLQRAKESVLTTQIAPLRRVLENAEALTAKHREYETAQAQLTELETKAEEYKKLKEAVMQATEQLGKLDTEHDKKSDELFYQLSTLQGKIKLLHNSGCPHIENAHCRFLADALEAQETIKGVEAAIETEEESYATAHEKASETLEKARQAFESVSDIPERTEVLRATIRTLTQYEHQYHQIETVRQSVKTLEDQIADYDSRIAEAKETIAENQSEADTLQKQISETVTILTDYLELQRKINTAKGWTFKEKELPTARERKSAAESRIAELTEEIAAIETELAECKVELTVEQAKTANVDELEGQINLLETIIEEAKKEAQAAIMTLGGLKKQLEELEQKTQLAAEYQRKVNNLSVRATIYEELKRAFSQDGIPHNIIRSIIPVFEATATNILGQMSQGNMSVEFVTEKVLKSNNKKEVTTLDIIINDGNTGRLPYMSRSGGERVKAALSVILALAEIKSSKAGVQLGFLFIDEPPFLDQPGVQAYCDALEAIQKRYSDLKVMAITHDPAMKSRFPQSVDVIKTDAGSKIIYQ